MIQLSINLNKIALIRNSKEGNFPSVCKHASKCLDAGAHGITIHPRPDQRHIRASDVGELHALLAKDIVHKESKRDRNPDLKSNYKVELNVEGNPFAKPMKSGRSDVSDYPGFMALIEQYCPEQCTLVPDNNAQLTSDHGFDLRRDGEKLKPIIERCKNSNSRVSLFMDPDVEQIKIASDIGADRIELYTGPFAAMFDRDKEQAELLFEKYCLAAECASDVGLGVNAGHDLNLRNLPLFATLPALQEVSIGHAFTVDCIELGLSRATEAYLQALSLG